METRSDLSQNRILRCLPAADLATMQKHLIPMRLVQGAVLYFPSDEIDYVCFPQSGIISLLTVMKSGEHIEAGIVGRSGVVGATIGSYGPLAYGLSIVQIGGHAVQLPRGIFLSMFETSAALRRLVNEYGGFLYFQAMQSAACHAVHTVQARFCRWMLQSQDLLQSELVGLTQESLAQMLGVQRAAVSLCAQQLQVAGLIQYSRGSITIVDRKGLKETACECYEATRNYTERMSPTLAEFFAAPLELDTGASRGASL